MKIGITGQAGFVGTHLYNTLGLFPEKYTRIPFEDAFFSEEHKLREFVRSCDVIVHLAAVNRCPSEEELYRTNIRLVTQLIDAMDAEKVSPHVLFSSSTQEERDNIYGRSKREGRELLETWARRSGANFTGLVIPNVFGPFGKPYYNSFVATFAHQLTHGETPSILTDAEVKLLYVGSLCDSIMACCEKPAGIRRLEVPSDFQSKVSEILSLMETFKAQYFEQGIIPVLRDQNDVNLFNTYRSYCEMATLFPRKLVKHTDQRGAFVETLRLGVGGQVSFSTTVPGVTRGNHYHTRKIERFTVIKGKAQIQMRKIGTAEVLNFELDGEEPSYVDMPIWYTHNITNIGDEDLYTQFWINEWYDPKDGDTFQEPVLKC
jgi:UDP-2-acetamido-2,6-beta-L-arabino-hexul-4-ose reductase